jgi:hypothetical protein
MSPAKRGAPRAKVGTNRRVKNIELSAGAVFASDPTSRAIFAANIVDTMAWTQQAWRAGARPGDPEASSPATAAAAAPASFVEWSLGTRVVTYS